MISSILEEIKNIKSSKKELRDFGITMGVIFLALSGFALWRGKAYNIFLIAGILFLAFGMIAPFLLKPLQKMWMAFSAIIGFFMSRVILTLLFFGVITPIGILMRLFGKDMLDQRISKDAPSYWHERPAEVKAKGSYENQY